MLDATQRVTRSLSDPALTEHAHNASRSLGALEHLFWLLDQNRPVHFVVTALISGETSPCDWRRALDRLQERHPIMSVCIDGKPGSIPSFHQTDARPIPLRIVADEPEGRWEAEVAEELATPFNPRQAPLVRAVLIQGARDAAFMPTRSRTAFRLLMQHGIRLTCSPDAPSNRSLGYRRKTT